MIQRRILLILKRRELDVACHFFHVHWSILESASNINRWNAERLT